MRARTNIARDPLFPVRWTAAARSEAPDALPDRLGLRDVLLRSHDIEALAVTVPPAHSALLRILYALTARVTGLDEAPRGPDEWSERRWDVLDDRRLPADAIGEYFDRLYPDRFYLHDPDGGRPWMQDARLAEQCDPGKTAGVNKLVVTRPSGNNHSWFGHASDADPELPTASDAVLSLLVWHYYGPSGRISARELGGVKSASAAAGPLRTALSYHPEGDTLFETLLAGLVPPERTVRRSRDLCPWESDEAPDPDAAPPALPGPCSRLTAGSHHALLLVPDDHAEGRVRDAYITWAYRKGRPARVPDDYLIWQLSQQGNTYPRPADSGRALWRDVDALLLAEAPGSARPQRPKVFQWAHEVPVSLRVRALGFEQDGQAKDTQFIDAGTPAVLGLVEEQHPGVSAAVGRLRQLGERYGYRLSRAVQRAWRTYLDQPKAPADAWLGEARAHYWPAAEAEFWERFASLDREAPGGGLETEEVRRAFLSMAVRAFDHVTAGVCRTQRGARAVEAARVELYGGPRKTKPTGGQPALI